MDERLRERLARIRALALDVDGVLTDGSVLLGPSGETKRFNVADGLGLQLLAHAQISVVWISGRRSEAVSLRARELGVPSVLQGVSDKGSALSRYAADHGLDPDQIGYMGDDLNDLPAMAVAGCVFAPSNSCGEVKAAADYVATRPGGSGAVREVCEAILSAQGRTEMALAAYLRDATRPDPEEHGSR